MAIDGVIDARWGTAASLVTAAPHLTEAPPELTSKLLLYRASIRPL